ncbi:hypothetical protein MKW98_007675 [Papaver atlanticum]|uniref:Homeobox-leucine zipper protein n=1 Tax=Papaver atlanticum TaxID=357466 RepID=A0AAD4S3G8_9MAGN|nr:hypothetical protein MKW98_007675 [Papaver atlanticum]
MAFLQSPNQKQTPKRLKKRLTEDQVRLLESHFNYEMKLEPDRKIQLARELGLQPRQVAIWYQNKRARWKNQTLELDYKALQLRLDSVAAEKRRLEREVGRLRGELQKAQDAIIQFNPIQLPPSTNQSLQEEVTCTWENVGQLQVDDLFACLMGAKVQKLQN